MGDNPKKELEMKLKKLILTAVGISALGIFGFSGLEAMGRNPEAANSIQTAMTLAIAFAEAIAIYALVTALILKFT